MQRLGRYVLLERIAAGGMAEVFRAVAVGSAGFAKPLAIKRVLPHLASDQSFATMLIDEAKIASTLTHPNILQVLDLGRHAEVYFIAMEFVAGQPLNSVLARAIKAGVRVPLELAVHVVSQALQGLAYAHQKTDATGRPMGIIHRDVSPQNIMVAYDGSVRLADFGIAKAAQRSTQTLTGSIKGKPRYMSPEQVLGEAVDQRMDIYAMGVVLHELITMRRMRTGDNDLKIIQDVASGAFPRFEDVGVQVPPEVAAVVYRALAPAPSDRWQDASSFAHALDDLSRTQGWHCGQPQVAAFMRSLFAAELAAELQAQQTFGKLAQELAEAVTTEEINDVIARVAGETHAVTDDMLGGATTVTPHTPSGMRTVAKPSRTPLVAAVVGVAGLLGAGGWWLTRPVETTPAPAVTLALANLIVETEPAGATVTWSGRTYPGVTPLVVRDLPPGPVELEVLLAGMEPVKKVMVLEGGKTERLSLTLTPAAVVVPVTTTPPGATVLLDGKVVGRTPTKITLSGSTPVQLRVELKDFAGVEQSLLAARAPSALNFTLTSQRPADPPPSRHEKTRNERKESRPPPRAETPAAGGVGKLTLHTRPWGRLSVDGKDTGRYTPVLEMPLPAGQHEIQLVNDEEGLRTKFTVTIVAGETLKLTRELK
ncbi:MAG: serine/threonine-protein kinase [Myxococcota bacterium]